MEQKLWVRMPTDLIGKISFGALTVLSLLLNRDMGTHVVEITQTKFADSLQCDTKTLNKFLIELEQAELITKTRLQNATQITLAPDILPPRKLSGAKSGYTAKQPRPQSAAGSSIDMDEVARIFG